MGQFRVDLLVEGKVVIELKATPELLPIHQAQLISYLKGFEKPIGILANFGGVKLEHQIMPNKADQKVPLQDHFDYDKIQIAGREKIRGLLEIANKVLIHLGAGYIHQIYRRAMYWEMKQARLDFRVIRQIHAEYQNRPVGGKEVNFFVIGDLLLSTIAVQALDDALLHRFCNHVRHLHCPRGLIFNFNHVHLDFRYFEL